MDLKKIPPSLLFALGLGCEGGVDACLSPGDPTEMGTATTGTATSATSSSTTSMSACLDVGPCLSETTAGPPSTSTGMSDSGSGDVSTGPCLSPPLETTGTDSGSGSGSGSDSGTTGGMAVGEPDAPASRAAAMQRVLERGTLPADVAARLAAKTEER